MRFLANAVFVALFGVFISGCSLTFPARLPHKKLDVLLKTTIERCDTNALPIPDSLTHDDTNSFVYQPRNTGVPKNDIIRGEFFVPKPPRHCVSLVTLLPGTGEDVSTKEAAEILADAGFCIVRFRSGIEIFDIKKLAQYEVLTEDDVRTFAREGARIIERRACDYRTVINYFDRRFCFRAVGVSGVSLGGIFTPILAGSDPKAQGNLEMISGANIVDILHFSQERKIVEIRELIAKKFVGARENAEKMRNEFSVARFSQFLDPHRIKTIAHNQEKFITWRLAQNPTIWEILKEELFDIDPLRFAPSLDPSQTRIIANYWDAVIPIRYARELWEAAGKPDFEVIIFPPGHYGSVFLLWIPMIRYELACLAGPICFPVPWSIGRIPEVNLQFFKEKLPR